MIFVTAVISRGAQQPDATAFPSVSKDTMLTEILKRTQFFHVEVCYFMQNICNPGVVLKPCFRDPLEKPSDMNTLRCTLQHSYTVCIDRFSLFATMKTIKIKINCLYCNRNLRYRILNSDYTLQNRTLKFRTIQFYTKSNIEHVLKLICVDKRNIYGIKTISIQCLFWIT